MRYEDNPAENISKLKEMWAKSPLHYHHRLQHPRESTPALGFGIAAHMCVLEPERFRDTYTVRPDWVKGNTKAGKAWLSDHGERTLLTEANHTQCLAIREALLRHPCARVHLERGGEPELAVYWKDDETRMACKGRVDLFGPRATVGLKTARTASPRKFAIDAARFGYHLQWAYYHDGLIASGRDPGEMVELVVESEPPHDVVVYVIDDETLDIGRDAYREQLVRLGYCREHDDWPGAADEEVVFRLPPWSTPNDDDDLGDLTGLEEK